jgi:hypothetical protein
MAGGSLGQQETRALQKTNTEETLRLSPEAAVQLESKWKASMSPGRCPPTSALLAKPKGHRVVFVKPVI